MEAERRAGFFRRRLRSDVGYGRTGIRCCDGRRMGSDRGRRWLDSVGRD